MQIDFNGHEHLTWRQRSWFLSPKVLITTVLDRFFLKGTNEACIKRKLHKSL